MNLKTWAPAIAAVLLGGVAAKLARDALSHSQAAARPSTNLIHVVTAKELIEPGQEFTADRLTLSTIASPTAPPNTFKDVKDLSGRISTITIIPGQTVLEDFLAPKGAAPGLPALVPQGMRAVTIDVTETSSLGGMLVPGCHVDVVGTIPDTDSNKVVARTIVQNVLVQAVGQRLSAPRHEADDSQKKLSQDAQAFRSVTLISYPKDAVAIQLAAMQGRVTLMLRGTGDGTEDDVVVRLAELRGGDVPYYGGDGTNPNPVMPIHTDPVGTTPSTQPSPVADSSHVRWIETYHGNKLTRVQFDAARQGVADWRDPGDPIDGPPIRDH